MKQSEPLSELGWFKELAEKDAEIATLQARIKELEASKLVFVPEMSDDMGEIYLEDNIRLQARIKELEAEANKNMIELCEARARIRALENPELMVKELHYQNGKLDISASHPVFVYLIEECSRLFDEAGAVNFLCLEMIDEKDRRFDVTIQLEDGKTPAARMHEMEAEIAVLQAEVNKNMAEPCEARAMRDDYIIDRRNL